MKTPHTTIHTSDDESGNVVTTTVSQRTNRLPPKVSRTRPRAVLPRSSFRQTTDKGVHIDVPASDVGVITWIVYTVYDTDTMKADEVKRAFRYRLRFRKMADGSLVPSGLSSVGCSLNEHGKTIAQPIQSVDCQNGAGERAPMHVAQPGKAFHAWEVRGTREAINALCEFDLVVQSGICSHAPLSVKPPMNAIGSGPLKVKPPISRPTESICVNVRDTITGKPMPRWIPKGKGNELPIARSELIAAEESLAKCTTDKQRLECICNIQRLQTKIWALEQRLVA